MDLDQLETIYKKKPQVAKPIMVGINFRIDVCFNQVWWKPEFVFVQDVAQCESQSSEDQDQDTSASLLDQDQDQDTSSSLLSSPTDKDG